MNFSKVSALAVLAGAMFELSAAPKMEDIAGARIFAVNYTLSQESVKAQLAKGKADGKILPANRKLRFDYDILSTTN